MAVRGDVVAVGLSEVKAALKQYDNNLPKAIRTANRVTSRDIVKPDAHRNLASQPVPNRRAAVTHRATATSASIALRYSRFPWAGGAEFGSIKYRQFKTWLGNQFTGNLTNEGYIIGPAIGGNLDHIDNKYAEILLNELGHLLGGSKI